MQNNITDQIIGEIRKYTNSAYDTDVELLKTSTFIAEDFTRTFLGVVLVILYMLIGLIIALDICYITLPFFQEIAKKYKLDVVNKYNQSIISKCARDAVIEANTVNTGVSPIWIYIKKRYFSLIILILLTALIFMNYSLIFKVVENIVLGTLDGISNIFNNTDIPSALRDSITKIYK